MTTESAPVTSANPKPSAVLMITSQVIGTVGVFLGFYFLFTGEPVEAVRFLTLITTGIMGLVSFARHSITNRSDAARMHWDYGRRNDFQVEVGYANLAWGLIGILSVAFAWGFMAQVGVTRRAGCRLKIEDVLLDDSGPLPEALVA